MYKVQLVVDGIKTNDDVANVVKTVKTACYSIAVDCDLSGNVSVFTQYNVDKKALSNILSTKGFKIVKFSATELKN